MTRSWANSRTPNDRMKMAASTTSGSAHRRDAAPADSAARSAADWGARCVASTDTMGEPPRTCFRAPLAGVDAVDDDARREPAGLLAELLGERRDLQPFAAR